MGYPTGSTAKEFLFTEIRLVDELRSVRLMHRDTERLPLLRICVQQNEVIGNKMMKATIRINEIE